MKLTKHYLKLLTVICILILSSNAKAQMFWNQTAQFAGTSTSYLSVANTTDLNLTGDFTMEAWVFPTSVSGTEKGLFAKGPSLGASLRYAVKISTIGRVTISTNGILRLTSTVSLTVNTWTHVSATYNAATGTFAIYFNGVLNTSAVVAAAAPPSNTDSLYIGVAGGGLPFAGQLDEVRLWKRTLTATEVAQYFRTTIGTASGVNYFSLVLSYPFQKNNSGGTLFSLTDWTGNGNNAFGRNITPINIGNTQYVTVSPVECLFFAGSGEYVSGSSNSLVNPSSAMTIEAWVYPRSYVGTPTIVSKNSATSYKIAINTTGKLQYFPKGGAPVLDGKGIVPLQRWSHITAQYDGTTTSLYINGVLDTSTTAITGAIGVNSDSLYVGCDLTGSLASKFFSGWIDEVRIANYIKTPKQIKDFMFKSIDSLNQPNPAMTNVSYNFDGLLADNGDGGPRLYFGDSARFSQVGGVANQPIGPMLRDESRPFVDGYNMKPSFKRVPVTGGSGTTDDSITIPFNININDINVFVAINHTDEANLDVSLIGPNGQSVILSTDGVTAGGYDHLITIFDDQAVNTVTTTSYTAFTPAVRPEGNLLGTFGGDQTQGVWTLRVTDDGGTADTGRIYAWGIQFNNSTEPDRVTTLNLTSVIQGFWNGADMVQDTMRVYLRNTTAPYTITDSAKVFLSPAGTATMSFISTGDATKYISLKHRNSIDTWSATGVVFKKDSTTVYDFSTASNKAYGNNQILKLGEYCIYSGDINKDASVNLTDLLAIYNDNVNFAVGYIRTDVNGDNFINLDDILLTSNNVTNFVVSITPP